MKVYNFEVEILQPSYIPPWGGGENNSIMPVIGGGKGWCSSLTWLDTSLVFVSLLVCVCACASSPALFRSLELTTTTLPSFFISSSLPLPIFVLGRPKTLQVLSSHHVYWRRHFPFDLVSLDAQTPAGLYRSLEGVELRGGP